MIRSKLFVFSAPCLLAQAIRAKGLVREFPAVVTPVIDLLIENEVNIFSMPCPELYLDSMIRRPCQKRHYDTPKNRATYRRIGLLIARHIRQVARAGYSVVAILGVEFSPSCAIDHITASPPQRIIPGQGILIEELAAELHRQQIEVPMISVNPHRPERSLPVIKKRIEEARQRAQID